MKIINAWFLKAQKQSFFLILKHFLLFYLSSNPENQNFESIKTAKDIIDLRRSTMNDNDLMYGSWDMK